MSCGCGKNGMTGCGGRLCNACRPVLKRFTLYRYPLDSAGAPCLDQTPEEFLVCGFTAAALRANVRDKLEIPGRTAGGFSGLRLTVIGHSCEAVLKGDRIEADGELYRVAVVQRGTPSVAVLVPAHQGGQQG